MDGDDTPTLNRRDLLATGAAAAGATVGIGAFTGTAAAWDRYDVAFKGCSEVWMIVGEDDVTFEPPTVAHVVVADGRETDCRLVEFTPERATTVPGQHGDSPVVKYVAGDGEKVIGVIHYNYRKDRLSDPVCLMVNDHPCANTPGTPDPREADCATPDAYDCWFDTVDGRGPPGDGRDVDDGEEGEGKGEENGKEEEGGGKEGNGEHGEEEGKEKDEEDEEGGRGRGPPGKRGPPRGPSRNGGSKGPPERSGPRERGPPWSRGGR
jgi:hypothetical protein